MKGIMLDKPTYIIEDMQSQIEKFFDKYPIKWVEETWEKARNEAMEKAGRMNMGRNCVDCWCSTCEYLDTCGMMNGNTKAWCEEVCIGEESCTTNCSQFKCKKRAR